jgi:hypothetical protein
MKVKITSSFTNESYECEWTTLTDLDDRALLNRVYDTFQRVTSGDHDRLAKIGYELPSISAGDRIEIDGKAWRVDAMGFSPDDRDPNEPLQPWPFG